MNRIVVFIASAVFGTTTAVANNIVVNSTADSGSACTLRNAIDNANSNSATHSGCAAGNGADLITFDSGVFATPQTITLGSSLPLLTDTATTTIDGGNVVTVDGNNVAQVFGIGFTSPSATAILRNLTVAHGTTDSYGGGVFMSGATLELDHDTLLGNQATYGGGGLWTQSGVTTIDNCVFTANSSPGPGSGGGIGNSASILNISNSTFTGNSAGSGGGAIFTAYGGTMTITNSTFNGNSTGYYGSAIRNFSSDPANAFTTVTLDYVTIVGNSTGSGYGALDAETNASNTVSNSIIAGNTGGDCNGTINDLGHNFYGNNSCGAPGSGDPQLAPLGYTGGLTPTMPPLTGSPVIDAAACDAVTTDQRGLARPQGDGCDIGAAEAETSLFADGFEPHPV
ncbi:MAG TPA: choice-of-anchor Q domain-containing protein [Rudaea sp.]|jgi:predicted outer membrane repeat protein|nr:choice-of-anchor Q domain-containing protein [Rudaea sp.]